jgi:hypothetical protein
MRRNFVKNLTAALGLAAALTACAPDASPDGRDLSRVAQAVTFPGDVEFYPLHCPDGSTSDVPGDSSTGNRERDIVGNETYPSFYRARDAERLYFRMRVSLDPSAPTGGLQPSGWDVLFDFDGDLRTYEYMLTADGNLGGTRVQWVRNSVQEPSNPYDGAMDTPSDDLLLDLTPASAYYSVKPTGDGSNFGNDPDFFITVAVPISDLVATGIDLSGSIVAWAGTSAQSYGLNGDINCTSTFPPLEDVAPPPAFDPHVPDAASDAFEVLEDTPTALDVLANDWGLLDVPITVTITSLPEHGTVEVNGDDGTVTYTPDPNFNGTDFFTYTVADADDPPQSSEGSVTVTVVDDGPPHAIDDLAQTSTNTAVEVSVLANDSGLQDLPITVTISLIPTHGTAEVNGDLRVTYRPDPNWNGGTDSFTYQVKDADDPEQSSTATVTVTVTPPPAPPTPPADGGSGDGDGTGAGAASDGATGGTGASPGDGTGTGASSSDGTATSSDGTATSSQAVAIGVAGGGCSTGSGGAASALLVGLLALARRRR